MTAVRDTGPARPPGHQYASTTVPRSHTARVVEDLGLAIVSGRQPVGSLLPGDGQLLERYRVSRTVLREALKTLSGKGLIQAKARIGTRVRERADWNLFDSDVLIWQARSGFAPGFLQQLGEMRMALEPEAAALAAKRRTVAQLAGLHDWVRRMAEDLAPDGFVQADLGLHLAVSAAAGNPFFLSISTLIEVALVAMLTISSPAEQPRRRAQSVARHLMIVEAIAARDGEAARAAMRAVIQEGISRSKGK